jgi:hypothetical protein
MTEPISMYGELQEIEGLELSMLESADATSAVPKIITQ